MALLSLVAARLCRLSSMSLSSSSWGLSRVTEARLEVSPDTTPLLSLGTVDNVE